MSNARKNILERIRVRSKRDDANQFDLRQTHYIPTKNKSSGEELFQLFCKKVIKSAATYDILDDIQAVPKAVAAYLSQHPAFKTFDGLHINSPQLTELPWLRHELPQLNINNAVASLSQGYCGIAETGSIALLADAGVNTAAYFLPEILIVALQKKDIVESQEACWEKIQKDYDQLPRTITLATGPSRTGDIEQKLVIGAHGPRHEYILIIEN